MMDFLFSRNDLLAVEEYKAERTISTVRIFLYALITAGNILESFFFSLPLAQTLIVYISGFVFALLIHIKIVMILKNFTTKVVRTLIRYGSILLDIGILCLAAMHNLDVLHSVKPEIIFSSDILPVSVAAISLLVLLMDIFSFNMGSSFFAGIVGAVCVFLFPWIAAGFPGSLTGFFTYVHYLLALTILISSIIAALVSNSFRAIVVKSRRQQDLERFLSPILARKALDGTLKLNPGGQKLEISVLFSDIRGFTDFCERHSPEETVELLNEYFSRMIPVVFRHKGSLDKLLGDGLMAFFGVPIHSAQDRQNAFNAACEMREVLDSWNEERSACGKETIQIGIGLDGGEVIVGNLGTDRHMEYTAIGDPVNTASRIQSLTRTTGDMVLLSEYIAGGLASNTEIIPKGTARLKGKTDQVKLFSPSPPRLKAKK